MIKRHILSLMKPIRLKGETWSDGHVGIQATLICILAGPQSIWPSYSMGHFCTCK